MAALTLTDPRVLHELAYHAHGLRSRDELAAVLERRAVDAIRAVTGTQRRIVPTSRRVRASVLVTCDDGRLHCALCTRRRRDPPFTERRAPHLVALARLLWAVAVEAVRSALR